MDVIDQACRDLLAGATDGVACGVVDLSTGVLLGAEDRPEAPLLSGTAIASLAAVFQSRARRILGRIVGDPAPASDAHAELDEVFIESVGHLRFAKRIDGGRAVLTLVTTRAASVGMTWVHLRSATADLETLVRQQRARAGSEEDSEQVHS